MQLRQVILLAIGVSTCFAQPTDPATLRHDEAIALDHIQLVSNVSCQTAPNVGRTLSVDRVAVLNASGAELAAVDVGAQVDSFSLGQAWSPRETSAGITSRWATLQSSLYLPVPAGAATLQVRAAVACAALTVRVLIDGSEVGTFAAPANATVANYSVTLSLAVSQVVTYSVLSGGPVAVASLQWLSQTGTLLTTSNTPAEVTATPQVRRPFRPAGASSFCVNFSSPAPATSLWVDLNSSSAAVVNVPAGSTRACASETDPLERLADRKTMTTGWGDDLNARLSFRTGGSFTSNSVTHTGDTLRVQHTGTTPGSLIFDLPEVLSLSQFPYFAVRVKADAGSMYFIRPNGQNAQGQTVALWAEDSITDDRRGTGAWETLTFNLAKLAAQVNTNGTRITDFSLVMVSLDGQPHALDVDWIRIHGGLAPTGPVSSVETNFSNHIDDDGDGLTDRDDPDRRTAGRTKLFGVDRPVTLAFYHVWYGTPTGPSKDWLAWSGANPAGGTFSADTFVSGSPGQRNLWSRFYPLNTRDFPNYTPPNPLRYDLHGGVEQYDLLDPAFLDRQIRQAQDFGIEGFLADLGHQSALRPATEAMLRAVQGVPEPFSVAPLYDFFYAIDNVGTPEPPNYSKAREIRYFLDLAQSPRWTKFLGKPLITAPFASTLVSVPNWLQTVALASDPRASSLDGVIPGVQKGADNQVRFTFAQAQGARFETIVFRDADLKEISRLAFGTPQVRALLGTGWGPDLTAPLRPGVSASGAAREATMRLPVPANTEYIDVHATAGTTLNTVSLSFNNATAVSFAANLLGNVGYFRLSQPTVPVASIDSRPFSFLLDNPAVAGSVDGFATYSEFTAGGGSVLVSDDKPLILSVRPGYDDTKIRRPGLLTPRENGAYYRRSWEKAIAADPDAVFITSWNEWPEATNVEPSVEFGYQYAELTLTYSMILRGDLSLSKNASEFDFTVRRRKPEEITFSSAGAGQAIFRNIGARKVAAYTITRNGQPFTDHSVNTAAGTITVNMVAGGGDYRIAFAPAGPRISKVVNAASGLDGPVAPGEFITIGGAALGPDAFALGFDRNLGGVRVLTNGIESFITYAQANQLNVVLSNRLPTSGRVEIVVDYNGIRGDPFFTTLVPAAPGIFTQEYGPGQAWVFNQDNSVNTAANPAAKDSFVFFFATGPGLTTPILTDGEHPSGGVFPTPAAEVRVLLNGVPIPQESIVFKSLVYAAVQQVNIKIPANAPTGQVSLKISVGGVTSRESVTMAIR